MHPETPLNCPFSEHADRRAPAVRLTDETVEFLENRIASSVNKAWDDMLRNESVIDKFSKRLFDAFIASIADEANRLIRTSLVGGVRVILMAFVWASLGYVLFGLAGMSAAFKASFGVFGK